MLLINKLIFWSTKPAYSTAMNMNTEGGESLSKYIEDEPDDMEYREVPTVSFSHNSYM